MKAILKFRYSIFLGLLLIVYGTQVQAKKVKPRVSVEYHKIMGNDGYLSVDTKFKGDDGYEPCQNLQLNIYEQITEDSSNLLGQVVTDNEGHAEFVLSALKTIPDSVITYLYVVKVEDNDQFKDVSKKVKFMTSSLQAETVVEDSLLHIKALLTNVLGDPVKGEKVEVMVKRLFAPLTIGESYYKTDRKGTIMVPMEDSIPGVDGVLNIQVKLDSKKYGVITYNFDAPVGTVIVDESTFDQRTMWSPPSKTPLFLWIFPNIIIFGIWTVIVLLIMNLFKIYKS